MSENKLDKALNSGIKSAKDALAEKMIHLAHKEGEEKPKETVFNVTFTGTFTKDEKLVIAAMAKFFKQGQEATKRLLKPGRVVKSFPDKGPADKLANMLNGVGLACKVEMEVIGGTEEKEESFLAKAAFKLADSEVPNIHIPKLKEINKRQWIVMGVGATAILALLLWQLLKAPIVEGNSFASYEASLEKVVARAPEDQKAALKKSIEMLTTASSSYRDRDAFAGSEAIAAGVVFSRVDGLNAEEIIAAAESDMAHQRQQYAQEIESSKQTLASAEKQLQEMATHNTEVAKLEVSDARFVWQDTRAPEMMLKLTNNSNITITKVLFQGRLKDAKGKLLVSEPFAYGTAVGIRPGSFKYVTLTPSEESPWTVSEYRGQWRDLVFSATVENALDQSNQEIGVDLRPYRKAVRDEKARIKRLEKGLADIKL